MSHTLSPAVRIQKAQTALLLDHPFFGALLFRLGVEISSTIATMATDGVTIFYNPAFVDSLTTSELIGVLAHEVMHPALRHHTRRGGRDHKGWNVACDYAINPLLLQAGLTLPEGALVDERFRSMNAESIYNLLARQASNTKSNPSPEGAAGGSPEGEEGDTEKETDSKAPSTPGGFGQVLDAPQQGDNAGESMTEQARSWTIAVQQAEVLARQSGKLPGGVTRSLEEARAAGIDWRELLRRSWSDALPSDYCWTPPNRRHVWSGLYLPGIAKEGPGEVVVAIDCSGSVHARQLGLFEAELRSILEGQRPTRVHVLHFDTMIQKAEVYHAGEPVVLTPVGGGGTDFAPCFQWIEDQGIVPQMLVFFTDLCGTFPDTPPSYPVLWAATHPGRTPFGQVVPMEAA